ncbi:unnamed protein product, partial [Sphagnum balticum]
FSDESKCNVNECESGFVCAQNCKDMPIGYKCSCFEGFEPLDGGRVCKDIDECKVKRPCSQHCKNTYGSYSCSCEKGYISTDGGVTCKANTSDSTQIIFTNRYYIRQVDPHGHDTKLIVRNLTNAVALDFDWQEKCLYWSDVTPLGSSIKRICNFSSNNVEQVLHTATVQSPDGLAVDWVARNLYWRKKREIPFSSSSQHSQPITIATGLIATRGIAVDWIGKNIYWIDVGAGTITISTLDGSVQRTLISDNLDQPHDIVVDPQGGYIIWTDWGRKAKIEIARLDGSERKILVERNLQWPTGLAIDYASRRIFWTDPKASTIESINIDGKSRHIVKSFNKSEEKPYKIDVFEDNVYVSTFHNHAIFKMNKFGKGNITYLVQGLNKASDV